MFCGDGSRYDKKCSAQWFFDLSDNKGGKYSTASLYQIIYYGKLLVFPHQKFIKLNIHCTHIKYKREKLFIIIIIRLFLLS